MNTKKKKNRIILCICSIFLLVASIFSFIPLIKGSKVVYADTVTSDYSFSGSNISSKTTFNKGLFTKQLLQNTLVGFELSSTYDLVIYEKEEDISYPLRFYVKGDLSSPLVPSSALFQYDYSDGTKSYTTGVTFGPGRQNFLSVSFDGVKDLTKITLLNWCECYGTIEFAQLEEGDSFTGFVPYENSTYFNYEFDFYSSYREILGYTMTGHLNVNDNSEYRMAFSFSDPTTPQPIAANENFFIQDSARKYYVTYHLFCKYTNSDILDDSYNFCLYTLFDHSVDTTYPYFVSNVSYIVIGSYLDSSFYFRNTYTYSHGISTNTGFDIFTSKYNFISYVDYNGNNFTIFIPLDSVNEYEYFNYRTYYLDSINDTVTQSVFNQGYNSGYKDGENVGNENGFTNGYNVGKNDGYNLGYNTALNNDKYSFVSLISSVVDVPVKAFTSLFNFEILGVNLSGFFLGLLTCCIVIGVIRLIL